MIHDALVAGRQPTVEDLDVAVVGCRIFDQPNTDDVVYPQPKRGDEKRCQEEKDRIPVVESFELAARQHLDTLFTTHIPSLAAAKSH